MCYDRKRKLYRAVPRCRGTYLYVQEVRVPNNVLEDEQLPQVRGEDGNVPLLGVPLLQEVNNQPRDEVRLMPGIQLAREGNQVTNGRKQGSSAKKAIDTTTAGTAVHTPNATMINLKRYLF